MSQSQKTPLGMRKDPKRTTDTHDPGLEAADLLENTMPPTPLRDLLAADGASIYVLTDDAALLNTVREAGGEQYPVFPAGSWQGLKEAVAEKRCGIALLDIDAVKAPLTARLTELENLSPALVTLVASHRNSADGLLNLLSERKIHRLLIKPPTVGITRLLLESSVSRHIELRQRPELYAAPQRPASSGLAGWVSWLLAGSLVAGVLGTVVFTGVLNRPEATPVTVTAPSPRPRVNSVPPTVNSAATPVTGFSSVPPADVSATPSVPLADGTVEPSPVAPAPTMVVPEGVTAPMPANSVPATADAPAAPPPQQLDETFAAVEAALIGEDLDGAAALLAEIATIEPESTRVAFLQAQLERERARIAVLEAAVEAEAEAAERQVPPSEFTSLLGLARARLAQDQLASPAGDSALDYFARARAIDAQNEALAPLAAELGTAVLAAAEIELGLGRMAEAEALLSRAQSLGVSDEELVGLELSLVYARQTRTRGTQDSLIAAAGQRLEQGLVLAPAQRSALAALLEAQRLDPNYAALRPALAALAQALEDVAASALAVADWDRAAAAIDGLARAGAASSTLDPLRGALEYGQAQEAYLAQAAPASELNVVQFEPPTYPARAVARATEGWVDLEFIVDTEGLPRDIRVTGAEPPGEFETAALTAAGTYVYEPFQRAGRVYERRVTLRMRFTLE